MTKAIISAKGQVTIPKTIREQLKLTRGTEVALDVQGERVVIRRLGSGLPDWRTMRGMFRGAGDLQDDLAKARTAGLVHDDVRLKGA